MVTGGSPHHSQSSYGDCVCGIRRETVRPIVPSSIPTAEEPGAEIVDDDYRRNGGMVGGELVTQPAVHIMSADARTTQHFVTSQASQRSLSDDLSLDSPEVRYRPTTVHAPMATSQSSRAGDAPGDSESQLIERGRHVTRYVA